MPHSCYAKHALFVRSTAKPPYFVAITAAHFGACITRALPAVFICLPHRNRVTISTSTSIMNSTALMVARLMVRAVCVLALAAAAGMALFSFVQFSTSPVLVSFVAGLITLGGQVSGAPMELALAQTLKVALCMLGVDLISVGLVLAAAICITSQVKYLQAAYRLQAVPRSHFSVCQASAGLFWVLFVLYVALSLCDIYSLVALARDSGDHTAYNSDDEKSSKRSKESSLEWLILHPRPDYSIGDRDQSQEGTGSTVVGTVDSQKKQPGECPADFGGSGDSSQTETADPSTSDSCAPGWVPGSNTDNADECRPGDRGSCHCGPCCCLHSSTSDSNRSSQLSSVGTGSRSSVTPHQLPSLPEMQTGGLSETEADTSSRSPADRNSLSGSVSLLVPADPVHTDYPTKAGSTPCTGCISDDSAFSGGVEECASECDSGNPFSDDYEVSNKSNSAASSSRGTLSEHGICDEPDLCGDSSPAKASTCSSSLSGEYQYLSDSPSPSSQHCCNPEPFSDTVLLPPLPPRVPPPTLARTNSSASQLSSTSKHIEGSDTTSKCGCASHGSASAPPSPSVGSSCESQHSRSPYAVSQSDGHEAPQNTVLPPCNTCPPCPPRPDLNAESGRSNTLVQFGSHVAYNFPEVVSEQDVQPLPVSRGAALACKLANGAAYSVLEELKSRTR